MASLVLLPVIRTIPELVEIFERVDRPLQMIDLEWVARCLYLTRDAVSEFASFDERHFHQESVFRSPYLEVNCLSWRPGQTSSIHEHCGSAGFVFIVSGKLKHEDYLRRRRGALRPAESTTIGEGEFLLRSDRQIHRCGNAESSRDLVTLHFYSPPLAPHAERIYPAKEIRERYVA